MPSDDATKNKMKNDPSRKDKKKKRKKRRWGDAVKTEDDVSAKKEQQPTASSSSKAPVPGNDTVAAAKAKALALQDSIRAKLAALKGGSKSLPAAARVGDKRTVSSSSSGGGGDGAAAAVAQPKKKKARVFDLDMSVTAPTFERVAPAANEAAAAPAKKINPYLAHRADDEDNDGGDAGAGGDSTTTATSNKAASKDDDGATAAAAAADGEILDERLLRAGKDRRRHRSLNFIEPGTFVEIAERKRQKAANAVESGFASGRKAGTYYASTTMAEIYGSGTAGLEAEEATAAPPPPEADDKTSMPSVLEWWDVELLPSKLKKKVAAFEGKVLSKQTQSQMNKLGKDGDNHADDSAMIEEAEDLQNSCFSQASLSYSKTAALVQHIVPIKPPHAKVEPEVQPTLYLTKKERKRQRKLRRQEKLREQQDMQAAGLIAAPEPRLTLRNFMRVLGDQAYLDPSQMEQKVREQIEARQRVHLERNEANKLTKEQRSEKRAQKLLEDTKGEVHVALFYVKDMSHPYHRAKVELNAQQYNISGGVLECENPAMACVICEGGPKSIKKYQRLMTVRMKWQGLDEDESDDDEDDDDEGDDGAEKDPDAPVKHKFNKDNKCELVWTGLAVRRHFKGFLFQSCESSVQARKILKARGVGHMWDQVLACASGKGDVLQLKLGDSDNEVDDDDQADSMDVE